MVKKAEAKAEPNKPVPKAAGGPIDPDAYYRVDLARMVMYRNRVPLRPGPNLILRGSVLNAIDPEAVLATNRVY